MAISIRPCCINSYCKSLPSNACCVLQLRDSASVVSIPGNLHLASNQKSFFFQSTLLQMQDNVAATSPRFRRLLYWLLFVLFRLLLLPPLTRLLLGAVRRLATGTAESGNHKESPSHLSRTIFGETANRQAATYR